MLETVTNIEDVLSERPRDQTGKGRIDIRDVSVTVGKGRSSHRAVESTRLQIEPGEFVCLLGPSGCGKSTLLNAVAG
ncbi:MAG: ATP-binding cassette domain-containing protein, partial [Pseudomonadota bacterium]|nr:ATP-binding cassette domain-containing protein [Pseudomonadota bacterium]